MISTQLLTTAEVAPARQREAAIPIVDDVRFTCQVPHEQIHESFTARDNHHP